MFHCPRCQYPLDAPDLAGQLVACPACSQQFVMPGAVPPPIASVAQPAVVHHYHHRRGSDRTAGLVAALLSLFIPGLGQMCQGRIGAGFCFLVAAGLAAVIAVGTLGSAASFVALTVWVGVSLWAVVDAALA